MRSVCISNGTDQLFLLGGSLLHWRKYSVSQKLLYRDYTHAASDTTSCTTSHKQKLTTRTCRYCSCFSAPYQPHVSRHISSDPSVKYFFPLKRDCNLSEAICSISGTAMSWTACNPVDGTDVSKEPPASVYTSALNVEAAGLSTTAGRYFCCRSFNWL